MRFKIVGAPASPGEIDEALDWDDDGEPVDETVLEAERRTEKISSRVMVFLGSDPEYRNQTWADLVAEIADMKRWAPDRNTRELCIGYGFLQWEDILNMPHCESDIEDSMSRVLDLYASECPIDLLYDRPWMNWWEIVWEKVVLASLGNERDAIGKIRGFFNNLPLYGTSTQHWNLALQEILVEGLALIRPQNRDDRAAILTALQEIAEIRELPASSRLAAHILNERELPDAATPHQAREHRIFFRYVIGRAQISRASQGGPTDYTPMTQEDACARLALGYKS